MPPHRAFCGLGAPSHPTPFALLCTTAGIVTAVTLLCFVAGFTSLSLSLPPCLPLSLALSLTLSLPLSPTKSPNTKHECPSTQARGRPHEAAGEVRALLSLLIDSEAWVPQLLTPCHTLLRDVRSLMHLGPPTELPFPQAGYPGFLCEVLSVGRELAEKIDPFGRW